MKLFIISYNRLSFLKQQIKFFSQIKNLEIIIVDNGSTYPPLLDYLNLPAPIRVFKLNENHGHKVIWFAQFTKLLHHSEPYIVTDNDIIPEDSNFVDVLMDGLKKFPGANKIGLGLRTDDIPDHYPFKEQAIRHEASLPSSNTPDGGFVCMPVDTTLAIYRAGCNEYFLEPALRTTNCLAKHLTWYMSPEDMQSEENKFYLSNLKDGSSHWSYMQNSFLKKLRKRKNSTA